MTKILSHVPAFEGFSDTDGGFPNSKIYGANMAPTWVLLAPDGPHVGPMNLAIKVNATKT